MTIKVSKRGFVRAISFIIAAFLVVTFMAVKHKTDVNNLNKAISYQYMKGMNDLNLHIKNIDSDLQKLSYANSKETLSAISAKLWRESGFAKELLTSFPIEYDKLKNTNKFLSQVGDYCQSVAKEVSKGQEITKEQRENLTKFHKFSSAILNETNAINDEIQTGSLNLTKTADNISHTFDKQIKSTSTENGFANLDNNITAYPTLIYDGPFSDHIMQKKPLRLKGESAVTRAEAKERVQELTGVPNEQIKDSTDEESMMPSYGFSTGNADFSITKKGGLLSYMLKGRDVSRINISLQEAKNNATAFLDKLINVTSKGSIVKFKSTYHVIENNVVTFNFACLQQDVLIYTELIKIGVALDNGEITSFDARGYITNHIERDLPKGKISKEQAAQKVSSNLKIEKVQSCVIPSSGLNELLCYEFLCSTSDKNKVLVYINMNTGTEEQILILIEDENGQLTI